MLFLAVWKHSVYFQSFFVKAGLKTMCHISATASPLCYPELKNPSHTSTIYIPNSAAGDLMAHLCVKKHLCQGENSVVIRVKKMKLTSAARIPADQKPRFASQSNSFNDRKVRPCSKIGVV